MTRFKWVTPVLNPVSYRVRRYALVFLLPLLLSVSAQSGGESGGSAESYDERKARLIALVSETEDFADWLSSYEGWQGKAWPKDDSDEDGLWYVEFKDENDEEWLGYADVDPSGTIENAFIPRPLPDDELAEGKVRVRELVLADPEVAARLTDPLLWDIEADYDRFDVNWDVNFYRGLEHLRVIAKLEDDAFYIEEVRNERTFGEEDALEHAKDEAIRLAYEEVGGALEGLDEWQTYVEHQGGSTWSVSFVAGETERFYALVDVEGEQVLESYARE